MPDRLDARQRAFCEALAALIREYTDVTGPMDDPDVMDAESRSGQPTLPHAALNEWVLVMSWVDLEAGGDSYITKACQPGMLSHHQLGLLRSWLVELER